MRDPSWACGRACFTAIGAVTAWTADTDGDVYTLVAVGSVVYVGGKFTHVGGQARNMLAALDAAIGAVTTWNPNLGGAVRVRQILVSDSVYVGGISRTLVQTRAVASPPSI